MDMDSLCHVMPPEGFLIKLLSASRSEFALSGSHDSLYSDLNDCFLYAVRYSFTSANIMSAYHVIERYVMKTVVTESNYIHEI